MRKKKVLLAVAIGFVALELLLQLGAIASSLLAPPPAVGPRADVVCLGDSYTAGIGASRPDAAYPVQLERRLRESGFPVHVANGGMPGQDSAFLLRRLPSLLRPETKVLCVLMAFNDTWSRPARVELATVAPAEDPAGFQWRWRTARLVALCFGFAENSWFRRSEQFAAQPDGMPRADAKPEQLADVAAGFRALDALGLTDPAAPPPLLPVEPDAAVRAPLAAVERQIAAGDVRAALPAAEQLVADARATVPALKFVAIAAHVAGDAERARTALARLEELAAGGDHAAVEAHLIVLLATHRTEQAIPVARTLVAKEPRSLAGWIVLQDATFALGQVAAFREVAPQAMRVCGRLLPPQTAAMARHLAEVTAKDDARRAARLLVAAGCLDGNAGLARATVNTLRTAVPWAEFASALEAQADEPVRARWRAILEAAYGEDGAAAPWAATLSDHLLQIGALCRDRGIRLVVLGYPFPHPQLESVQRAAAQQLGVPFVPLRERFDRELATRAWDELFVKNGHCNDAGYAIVAEQAAAAVAAALGK